MDMNKLSAFTATKEQLTQVGELVERTVRLTREVALAEEATKRLKAELRKLEERDLPDALAEAGLSSIRTPDGYEVGVKATLYASIPKKNLEAAARWLTEHGLSSLVKPTVKVPITQGDTSRLAELVNMVSAAGYGCSVQDEINTGAVKAAIRELEADGVDVPLSLFGAHWVTRAEIKDPK